MTIGRRQELEARIARLESELRAAKAELSNLTDEVHVNPSLPLPLNDYRRYGRQMILDGVGLSVVKGQLKLRKASVLVVGAGGLGCPAIQYLSAAGVGTIGIVDNDVVELSNLQRQVLHCDATVGMQKTDSAKLAAERIQPNIRVVTHTCSLTKANAKDILSAYDTILDCTDNLPTRYLLSDTAVRLNKPLVSGAALKFDGQLCVYNLGPDGPCYRCIFPKPPPREGEGTCEEVGVLGAVTGVIGTLQALEAVKVITSIHSGNPSLLIYSALANPPFRTMKLRSKRPSCPSCGLDSTARKQLDEVDYVAFCGGDIPDRELTGSIVNHDRIKAEELAEILRHHETPTAIIDVRPVSEFSICALPASTNIPLPELTRHPERYLPTKGATYVVCRLGNDSQVAVEALKRVSSDDLIIKDLVGGLRAWSRHVDPLFPVY